MSVYWYRTIWLLGNVADPLVAIDAPSETTGGGFDLMLSETLAGCDVLNGTAQTVFQRHQFLAASHHVLQLIRRDLTTL